jgi:hypothetical protein
VLDAATQAVYRIDLKGNKASPILKSGQTVGGTKVATPTFITPAGPDVLILDSKNVLYRWRPADKTGKGTLAKVAVKDSSSWGDDVRGIGTFERNKDQGLYNLYVIDPSSKQILAYSPAFDGGGFPGKPTPWLAAPQDVATVTSMLIDGDIYLARPGDGSITRYVKGGKTGWKPEDPGDSILRTVPTYSLIASGTDKDQGDVYAYDKPNARILAFAKDDGSLQRQYRLSGDDPAWADVRGMYVVAGTGTEPATLVWIDKNRLMTAILEAVKAPTASPSASSSPGASASPKATAKPKPTKKPRKTPKP